MFVGIDTGTSGGIVGINERGRMILAQPLTNMEGIDIYFFLRKLKGKYQNDLRVFVEKVFGFINRDGDKNVAAAHTMFVFGQQYERVILSLQILKINYKEVLPKEWQKYYQFKRDKNEKEHHYKKRMLSYARNATGSKDITTRTSDAYLIGYYGYQTYKETSNAKENTIPNS